jgi:outer membrane protein
MKTSDSLKKTISSSALGALIATTTLPVMADTVFGVYIGGGSWDTEFSGEVGDDDLTLTTKELGIKDKKNKYYYIAIEHPVPVLPNIKLQQTDLTSKQTATIVRTFSIGDETFTAGTDVTTDFDLSYTDATLYYEILDNWVNIDLGITARKFSGYLRASSTATTQSANEKLDATLPMLYTKFQFDLPLSGLSAGLDVNYVSYDGNTLSDYSAKIGYTFDSVVDAGLELGIRKFNLKIDEDEEATADLELSGPYIAALFHF